MGKKRSCVDCGEHVPSRITVDGKQRNLKNRTRCLACLPFGSRSKRKPNSDRKTRNALKMRKWYDTFKERHGIDPVTHMRHRRRSWFMAFFNGCQLCEYSKTIRNLAFHHVDPETKEYQITLDKFTRSLSSLLKEVKKCILVCHNCHGEIHEDMVSKRKIRYMQKQMGRMLKPLFGQAWEGQVGLEPTTTTLTASGSTS